MATEERVVAAAPVIAVTDRGPEAAVLALVERREVPDPPSESASDGSDSTSGQPGSASAGRSRRGGFSDGGASNAYVANYGNIVWGTKGK